MTWENTASLYGLIGYPLSHSFSKRYFTEKFTNEQKAGHFYELFPLEKIEALPDLLKRLPQLKGLNVTIPYKEMVIPFLDEIDAAAKSIGAVNTIKILNGKLKGFNTDVYGFEKSLLNISEEALPKQALILGTGGAAKAVAYVLNQLNISFLKVSRGEKGDLRYSDIDASLLQSHPLIVNTTPLGMSPKTETCPDLPYQHLNEANVLYDLVYNPEKTLFLKRGTEQFCKVKNGLEMLHLQAEKAWEIWNDPDTFKC